MRRPIRGTELRFAQWRDAPLRRNPPTARTEAARLRGARDKPGPLMKSLTVFMSGPLGPLLWLTLGGALLFVGWQDVGGPLRVGLTALSMVPLLAAVVRGSGDPALFSAATETAPGVAPIALTPCSQPSSED